MLFYLFEWLDKAVDLPGAEMFRYLSFRSGLALLTSLLITIVFGKRLINFLKAKQVGEDIRDLGLDGQKEKQGTPTMGGIIILLGIIIPVILFARIANIYIIIMMITTLLLGTLGFLDDYIKVFKKNKKGLKGVFKIIGQVAVGIIVGLLVYFSPDIVVDKFQHSNITTIPFFKNNEIDYSLILGRGLESYAWLVFVPIVIFIITAVSNSVNLTDGVDGLATGTSAIMGVTLIIFAWVSGNAIFSNYLNIMFIPNAGELTVFLSAFIGSLIGFLWYNAYPAQIFMGDTGSLSIGGIIAVIAILLRKELLLPLICFIPLMESVSVIVQRTYFKYTKKRYGEGKRVFLMSPLHHHFQIKYTKKGWDKRYESKLVMRFLIVTLFFCILAVVTLKMR